MRSTGSPFKRLQNGLSLLRPVLYGIYASFFYGIWGFCQKLTVSQDAIITNLIVFAAALLCSLIGITNRRPPSICALLAGISCGIVNALVLVVMKKHPLIVVYPLFSFGSLLFIILRSFLRGGVFSVHSKAAFWLAAATSSLGLTLCGLGLAGGISNITNEGIDIVSIALGLLISVLTGLWIFLAFVTVVDQGFGAAIASTWVFLGSFATAVILVLISGIDLDTFQILTKGSLYAALAGASMFCAALFSYRAFSSASLANYELIPVAVLSALVLGENTIEGFAGTLAIFAGSVFLNFARPNLR